MHIMMYILNDIVQFMCDNYLGLLLNQCHYNLAAHRQKAVIHTGVKLKILVKFKAIIYSSILCIILVSVHALS